MISRCGNWKSSDLSDQPGKYICGSLWLYHDNTTCVTLKVYVIIIYDDPK